MQLLTLGLSGTAIAAALAIPLLATAGRAAASGGHGVTNAGANSAHGTFKLAAKHDDAAIEIEYQVDTNSVGRTFAVRLTDNGTVIAKRTATTAAPSGSFTVTKRTANRAGLDTIRAHAVSGANVCGGHVSL
jgi:hypothetical protein